MDSIRPSHFIDSDSITFHLDSQSHFVRIDLIDVDLLDLESLLLEGVDDVIGGGGICCHHHPHPAVVEERLDALS